MNAGFAFVSGSATNTEITTDGTRKGFFFRTVPPDAIQSTSVSNFISKKLKFKRVYIIDDQEAYSTGSQTRFSPSCGSRRHRHA